MCFGAVGTLVDYATEAETSASPDPIRLKRWERVLQIFKIRVAPERAVAEGIRTREQYQAAYEAQMEAALSVGNAVSIGRACEQMAGGA